jgi:hypothetical protein
MCTFPFVLSQTNQYQNNNTRNRNNTIGDAINS